jgi:pimeloyl-ACP methyl ester carboxylesterase
MKTTISFLYSTLTSNFDGIGSKEILIQTESKYYDAVSYKNIHRKKQKGTILVVNGFSVNGHKDERMVSLAKSIAKVGFQVIAVSFDDLNALKITPSTINDMVEVIDALSKNKDYAPNGKIAFLSPSYTAGMMMNACANRHIAHKVNAICAIGTFSNIEKSLQYLMNRNDIDDYGRNVLLYNFIDKEIGNAEGILKIIKTAIEDNGFKRNHPLLPQILAGANEHDLELWQKLNTDISFRKELLNRAFDKIPDKNEWLGAFDIYPKLKNIEATVVLVHGKNDIVIPPSESEELHNALTLMGKKSYLCITPVLDHGDIQSDVNVISDYVNIYKAFSTFFKAAKN